MQFFAGFIPLLTTGRTVCHLGYDRRGDAVEDDDAIWGDDGQDLSYDFLQTATVTSDKDCIRTGERGDICFEEVAHVDIDAWSTQSSHVFMDDGFAFRTDLESLDLQMGELQASLYRDAARTEADIPENMSLGKFEGLKCKQTNGHLGNHLLATIQQSKVGVGNAEWK